jgi:hypothetical protein
VHIHRGDGVVESAQRISEAAAPRDSQSVPHFGQFDIVQGARVAIGLVEYVMVAPAIGR